jgi:hypothetical protein
MPRETVKNRAGTFYARRDAEGQFSEVAEKGRSLQADRRTKAKTVVPKGEGDRGDQKPRAKKVGTKKVTGKKVAAAKVTSKKRAPAKKK